MRALAYWKAVTTDAADFLDRVVGLLAEDASSAEELPRRHFRVERFAHGVNVSTAGSDLRVQLQTDPRYAAFTSGASLRDVPGLRLPVARLEDVPRRLRARRRLYTPANCTPSNTRVGVRF